MIEYLEANKTLAQEDIIRILNNEAPRSRLNGQTLAERVKLSPLQNMPLKQLTELYKRTYVPPAPPIAINDIVKLIRRMG